LNPISKYENLLSDHISTYASLNRRFNILSSVRLLVAIGFIAALFFYFKLKVGLYLILALILLVVFLVLLKVHGRLSAERNLSAALVDINEKEIQFLEKNEMPFANGQAHIKTKHPYSYDLDMYGDHSIFQHLNRTSTYKGQALLADLLDHRLDDQEILRNQQAIKELREKLEWRQDFSAKAQLSEDKASTYDALRKWAASDQTPLPSIVNVLSFLLPILFISLFAYGYIGDCNTSFRLSAYAFIANLALLGSQLKKIRQENVDGDKSHKIIGAYSELIESIESQQFESEKLAELRNQLIGDDGIVSAELKKLGNLIGQLDNISNPIGTILFDGTFAYHVHVLRALKKWKVKYAAKIADWIEVIAQFEALNSLANYSFNNPAYVFPTLNSEHKISFTALGHPLINGDTRIGNDISFNDNPFVILTGSNMSGKSTFLRSLGVNMVLASCGAPVCAREANLDPMPVLVSMRLADNLSESESYFFAEVKRLKQIMEQAESERSFVLLDEILRGTNSNDKRSGTVEVNWCYRDARPKSM